MADQSNIQGGGERWVYLDTGEVFRCEADDENLADLVHLVASLPALLEWKCPSCGGSKVYRWQDSEQPCKVCEATGLHPYARFALSAAKQEGGAS